MHLLETTTSGPEETRGLGKHLGELTLAGLVVLLNGDLGAGKTCFAQGVGTGLGVASSSPVTSPSYTLLNIHQGRLPFYHFDLYRLSQVDDLADLGFCVKGRVRPKHFCRRLDGFAVPWSKCA